MNMPLIRIDHAERVSPHATFELLTAVPGFCAQVVEEALVGDLRCAENLARFCGEAIDRLRSEH